MNVGDVNASNRSGTTAMNPSCLTRRLLTSAAVAITLALSTLAACGEKSSPADSPDYIFSAATPEITSGAAAVIDIRLKRREGVQPITDAVILKTRLDMSPEGMAGMTAEVTPQPSPATGVYRFTTTVPMAGRWAFKLGAKVQGETDTVWGTVVLTAKK